MSKILFIKIVHGESMWEWGYRPVEKAGATFVLEKTGENELDDSGEPQSVWFSKAVFCDIAKNLETLTLDWENPYKSPLIIKNEQIFTI